MMPEVKLIKSRKHWIFDMDGTLTMSVHDFEHIRRELGIRPGKPILESLRAMPEADAKPLWAALDEMEVYYASKARIMTGAIELLQQLQQDGCKLAILTRNTMPVVGQTLAACAIDHFFPREHILDRDACKPKPAPDGIRHLLNLWQADAEDTVMVGDYRFDLEVGRAAGVATVHVASHGEDAWSELTDIRVEHLSELHSYLN